jgi:peptide deformylase
MSEQSAAYHEHDALGALRDRLRWLHRNDGEPSTREIARRTGRAISHTTVNGVLRCAKTPKWDQLELVVEALHGDRAEFHALWVAVRDHEDDRSPAAPSGTPEPSTIPETDPATGSLREWLGKATELVTEDETAELTYLDGAYLCQVRRVLYNGGPEPVIRYPLRITVDRYPDEPQRSSRHHRENPLTWEELELKASCGNEPMAWRAQVDRDSMKEVWLLFENADGRFPLYPSQRSAVVYSYRVGEDKWGPWFGRNVRIPTGRLAIHLDFPIALDPQVWGVEGSLSTAQTPLRTPLERQVSGERVRYSWSTERPRPHTYYRLEWRFRSSPPSFTPSPIAAHTPVRWSERLAAEGIAQRGAVVLRKPGRQFQLPSEEALARQVVARLQAALNRVVELHSFSTGLGLAAPQLGLAWAAAVVRPPDDEGESVILLNPRVVGASPESAEQYEGCLSFFDVRGLVSRPLRLLVEHESFDGARMITSFERDLARLVAHQIDHLDGSLYTDRMARGASLVPIAEPEANGRPWRY